MRILFVSGIFPTPFDPQKGPFNREMIRCLGVDHEIRVVCPIGWTELDHAQRRSLKRLRPDDDVTYVPYYYVPGALRTYRDEFMWWSIRGRLGGLTRAWRPDLLLAYWTHPDGFVARRLALRLGAPFVQIVGGSDVLEVARGLRKKKIVRMLSSADAVVTIGRDLGAQVVALGVDAGRVVSVYRPVSQTAFGPGPRQLARRDLRLPPDAPLVLWVGRFVPVKGLDVLIEATRQLVLDVPGVRVCLVGSGPEAPRIRDLVRRHRLDEAVRFVGAVPHDRLGPWYRAADVTVLPSRSEGVPNVLLESMACGTPFVATRVGGVPEIADPSVDRVVPAGDPAALSEALSAALSRRAEIARTGRTLTTPESLRTNFNRIFERVARTRVEPDLAQRSACERP